jgi:hypothetical protein
MSRQRSSIIAAALFWCFRQTTFGQVSLLPQSPPDDIFLVSADTDLVKVPSAPAVYEAENGVWELNSHKNGIDRFPTAIQICDSSLFFPCFTNKMILSIPQTSDKRNGQKENCPRERSKVDIDGQTPASRFAGRYVAGI